MNGTASPIPVGNTRALISGPGLLVTSPAPRDVWDATLQRDPEALVSQSPAWVDCMLKFGYEDASRLYETSQGGHVVLPMVRRSGSWPGVLAPQHSFPPAWGMGGLVADRPVAPNQLAAIVSDLRSRPNLTSRIRPNPLHAAAWSGAQSAGMTAIPRLAHVLDLAEGSAAVWRRLSKSARWGIRKAERSGLEIECDTSGRLVPVFFELLTLSIDRWARRQNEPLALARWRGRRRDPLEKFERMAAALGDAMRVWVAWKDGVPAASMVVLLGANASDTRGAMNRDLAGPTNANDLLQWLAIEDACEAGCYRYHLGESGSSRSLAHFKEKFGARPVPYSEYRIERVPVARIDALSRGFVKRLLRFRDA
jgi:hypothetical protein